MNYRFYLRPYARPDWRPISHGSMLIYLRASWETKKDIEDLIDRMVNQGETFEGIGYPFACRCRVKGELHETSYK